MKLSPVVSSNIESAAYLEDEGVMLVKFGNGSLYAYPGVMPEAWEQFNSAASKGTWVATFLREKLKAVLIQQVPGEAVKAEPTKPEPLQSYQEDECCGKRIRSFLLKPESLSGSKWECPRCGQQWAPRLQGTLRHWYPVVATFVARRSS